MYRHVGFQGPVDDGPGHDHPLAQFHQRLQHGLVGLVIQNACHQGDVALGHAVPEEPGKVAGCRQVVRPVEQNARGIGPRIRAFPAS